MAQRIRRRTSREETTTDSASLEELRSIVANVFDLRLGDEQVAKTLLAKVNGNVIPERLLVAVLSVARARQDDRVAELQQEIEDLERDLDELYATRSLNSTRWEQFHDR
jgi:hypothetical protein